MSQSTANMRGTFEDLWPDYHVHGVLVSDDRITGNRFGQEEKCPFRNMV